LPLVTPSPLQTTSIYTILLTVSPGDFEMLWIFNHIAELLTCAFVICVLIIGIVENRKQRSEMFLKLTLFNFYNNNQFKEK